MQLWRELGEKVKYIIDERVEEILDEISECSYGGS